MILNRDSSSATSLGSAVVSAGNNNRNGNALNGSHVGRLGFFEGDIAKYPDEASVVHAVVENEYWGVVVGKPFPTFCKSPQVESYTLTSASLSQCRCHSATPGSTPNWQLHLRSALCYRLLLRSRPNGERGQWVLGTNNQLRTNAGYGTLGHPEYSRIVRHIILSSGVNARK